MSKEITFTTLENQRERQKEYSRSLSPPERLEYLNILIAQAYDIENAKKLSESNEIHISVQQQDETLEEFLRRRNKEKRA